MSIAKNKVTIIGAGMVGSTLAYSLVVKDTTEEIALIDLDEKLVQAQVLDLQHAVPFCSLTHVTAGSYDSCADSAVVVICCGAAQKPGQTRLDLVKTNAAIIKEIVPQVFEKNPDAILVMVTNPVDVLTHLAISLYPDKKNQIIGTGTLLDSARLRHLLSEKLQINPSDIHAYIIGEHGDSGLPLWSAAASGNMKLNTCEELSEQDKAEISAEAKNAAYTIIEGKQSTHYAIAAGCASLIDAILHNERSVLPISHLQEGQHGVKNMCLSMPVVVGREGIIGRMCIDLTQKEQEQLQHSAALLQETFREIA